MKGSSDNFLRMQAFVQAAGKLDALLERAGQQGLGRIGAHSVTGIAQAIHAGAIHRDTVMKVIGILNKTIEELSLPYPLGLGGRLPSRNISPEITSKVALVAATISSVLSGTIEIDRAAPAKLPARQAPFKTDVTFHATGTHLKIAWQEQERADSEKPKLGLIKLPFVNSSHPNALPIGDPAGAEEESFSDDSTWALVPTIGYIDIEELGKQLHFPTEVVDAIKEGAPYEEDELNATIASWIQVIQGGENQLTSMKLQLQQPIREKYHLRADDLVVRVRGKKASASPEITDRYTAQRMEGSRSIDQTRKGRSRAKNWQRADKMVRLRAESGKDLSVSFLCRVHKQVCHKESEQVSPGKMRQIIVKDAVRTGGQTGPFYLPSQYVAQEMQALVEWVNEQAIECSLGRANPIIVASQAYQRMASIHPFKDGNIRCAGLVMDYIFYRAKIPPPAMGKQVNVAIFGQQAETGHSRLADEMQQRAMRHTSTPDQAASRLLKATERTYKMLGLIE